MSKKYLVSIRPIAKTRIVSIVDADERSKLINTTPAVFTEDEVDTIQDLVSKDKLGGVTVEDLIIQPVGKSVSDDGSTESGDASGASSGKARSTKAKTTKSKTAKPKATKSKTTARKTAKKATGAKAE